MRRDSGFALLIVLWSLVLLSLILTQLLSAGRSEAQLAGNLRNAAMAEAIADGGVQAAVFHLSAAGSQAWASRGRHSLRIGAGVADIVVSDLSDEINPNTAGLRLLRAVIGLCGAAPAQATQLAQAIMVWRGAPVPDGTDAVAAYRAAGLPYAPLGLPMQSADELALVVGMTPALQACLSPHLSLAQDSTPTIHSADTVVARAVALAVQDGDTQADAVTTPSAVQIVATGSVPGATFKRQAIIRLGSVSRILSWSTPAPNG